MNYPRISDAERLKRLEPPTGRVAMVLDTDTYNEVDDQFALVYALASGDKLDVRAVYAAPFSNPNSTGPADGMEKSYDEIIRLMSKMGRPTGGVVFRGSTAYLPGPEILVESDAARDLVKQALSMKNGELLYVTAIGAITNVASAILLEPAIVDKIVVVWLGGNPISWPTAREFNLMQDVHAARVILDSGVPFVHIPCMGVASHLTTTVEELEKHIGGKNAVCDALVKLFSEYSDDHFAWAKEIWDISTIGWLIDGSFVPSLLDHTPHLSDDCYWGVDRTRHLMRSATFVSRNAVFRDMFTKLAALK